MSAESAHTTWHPGEETMHRLLRVVHGDNPTIPGLPVSYGAWMAESPLLALGTVDGHDRVWTTVLGGAAGVVRPVAAGVLGVRARSREPLMGFDPVLEALFAGQDLRDGGIARHPGGGKLVGGLAIDLETRSRVKISGRVLGGALAATDPQAGVQLAVAVEETLGNCPKYLNRKSIRSHDSSPTLVSDQLPLVPDAIELIGRSDLFALSSRHGTVSMDTNVRGGAPGFVRILTNSAAEGVTLVYPEYSGNRLFQTLGNLQADPAVGVTFPDVETGAVLYLSGRADVVVGADAAALLPHSKLAVRVHVEAARFVRDGLPFRGTLLDPSPYNPPVHRLAHEIDGAPACSLGTTDPDGKPLAVATATLLRRSTITPTISRYTFRLGPETSTAPSRAAFAELKPWRAGQHVTLDFSAHLDRGWSHMRDHDPRSLNDDYIRSFTISSRPGGRSAMLDGAEFDITVREQGPVTAFLGRWRPGRPVDVAVLGFGDGDEIEFGADPAGEDVVVVAAGVGITPLMAQARAASAAASGRRLKLFWSVRADDLPLAIDVLGALHEVAAVTDVFVTRTAGAEPGIAELRELGARVHTRRIEPADVRSAGTAGRRRFHVCAPPGLTRSVLEWVGGEHVRCATFTY
ncbi:pyridoxamine 5'-phosphate oxidase family protein [Amycolatopsis thailandensis]|uniref:pyridoxamine 5'-phosphate oxidase family protein n=1 Tax=Amycolatopsis thailandensis TaxID=589330 RepID=UPI00379A820F